MSPSSANALGGALRFVPGAARPIQGGRPVLSDQALQLLTHGVPAEAYAHRMAQLFSLCGTAHRLTARRAVQAARQARPGTADPEAGTAAEDTLLALWTAREHLQRLALELPRRLPVAGTAAEAGWLRGHPLETLPAEARAADLPALQGLRAALRPWLEARVLGGPAADWLQAWQEDLAAAAAPVAAPSADASATPAPCALHAWAGARLHLPPQRWLHGAAAAGCIALPCRALPAAQCEPAALRELAQRLLADPGFARQPTWAGQPAETGCWTRIGRPAHEELPHNAWMRWQYRIAELVALSAGGRKPVLAKGALALGDGIGLAWAEMSRGLLVHVVRLQPRGGGDSVDQGRLLAPTEWNFHPEGGLARALARPACGAEEARAAVAALDPCVEAHFPPPAGAHGHA